jgi:hypothetical protein
MTAREWIDAFAAAIGTEAPDDATVEQLLTLAGEAAHGSERTAAPIACWLAGRIGVEPAAALQVATAIGN